MKELRLFALKSVPDKLKRPSQKKKSNPIKPQPANEDATEKQNKRNENGWNPQRVAQAVYRMPMAVRISRDPLFVGARFVRAAALHGDLIIHGTEDCLEPIPG